MTSPYLLAPEELGVVLEDQPQYRIDQLTGWLYRTPVLEVDAMTNLPSAVRERIGSDLYPFDVEIEQTADNAQTVKWLFRTADGNSIEAVVMGYAKRTTLCISSQAGCAMGCTFCATGQFGFERHLGAGEIVAQVAYANAFLRKRGLGGSPNHVTNIVFMGMGEPLANYAKVRESLRRMIEIMGIGARSITVSTVGVIPGMRKLAEEPWQVNLAVSLHAADDELRSTLVPLNDRYPLAEVIAAARRFQEAKGRRVSIEWTLIEATNDSVEQAHKLAAIARGLGAHINVIALNPTPLTTDRPPAANRVEAFLGTLRDAGANVTLRDTRGQDIDAACGQLRVRAESSTETPLRLEPGAEAPYFNRRDQDGNDVTLDDYAGHRLVIFFYPRAFTPGCTTESCDFRDRQQQLYGAGYEIVGVSPDPVDKLSDFRAEHALPYPLLSDEDHSMAEAFGAWGIKKNYGKEYEGLIRSTIVLDEAGRVEHAWYNVKATGHAERVAKELAPG